MHALRGGQCATIPWVPFVGVHGGYLIGKNANEFLHSADLIAEGYEPGPRFAEMLAAVEDAQLEGRVGSREEAIKMVREMFPR